MDKLIKVGFGLCVIHGAVVLVDKVITKYVEHRERKKFHADINRCVNG